MRDGRDWLGGFGFRVLVGVVILSPRPSYPALPYPNHQHLTSKPTHPNSIHSSQLPLTLPALRADRLPQRGGPRPQPVLRTSQRSTAQLTVYPPHRTLRKQSILPHHYNVHRSRCHQVIPMPPAIPPFEPIPSTLLRLHTPPSQPPMRTGQHSTIRRHGHRHSSPFTTRQFADHIPFNIDLL
jgi:hypothetical protein